MHLVLPAGALLQIGNTFGRNMRAELLFKIQPGRIAFSGGHIRIFIHDVLEGVHHGPVGQEGEGLQCVHEAVVARFITEELFHVRPGKEFHAHGVGFGRLHAAAAQLQGKAIVSNEIGVEGVARLVGDDIHISGSAVEVGENEGLLKFRKFRAVAAAPFIFAAVHIKGVVFQHHVDKLRSFVAHGVIHLPCGSKDFSFSERSGVAARNHNAVIIEHIVFDSETLRILHAQAGHHRYHVTQDVFTEDTNLFLIITEPAHTVIAELDKVAVTHLFCHAVTHVDHTVIDAVQFCLMLLQTAAENLEAFLAGFAVFRLGVFHEHGAGHGFAPEGELHAAHEIGILPHQLVFFHHILHNFRRHGLAGNLQRLEEDRRELFFQLGTKGRIQKG